MTAEDPDFLDAAGSFDHAAAVRYYEAQFLAGVDRLLSGYIADAERREAATAGVLPLAQRFAGGIAHARERQRVNARRAARSETEET